MTGIAQTPSGPYVSARTPHLFAVTLVGAALVLTTIIRLLGADPVPEHPLSGAPVEGAVEPTLTLPDEASASIQAAGAPGRVLAGVGDSEPAIVGPLPVPRDGLLALDLRLPTAERTVVGVSASQLRLTGGLRDGNVITYSVLPGADGGAVVEAPVAELIGDSRAGIYQVVVSWNGRALAEEYLALGVEQPSGVAVFDEPRRVRIAAGRHTAVRFDATGGVRKEATHRARGRTVVQAVAYARFNGEPYVLIPDGRWGRHWMPLGDGVRLR
jgi:hypothetical protein